MSPNVEAALQDARQALREMYGDRLAHVVLYGSQARGDARADSDVDVLVVLRDSFELHRELKRLTRLKLELLDDYDELFAFQPYSLADYEDERRPFMHHVHTDGVLL